MKSPWSSAVLVVLLGVLAEGRIPGPSSSLSKARRNSKKVTSPGVLTPQKLAWLHVPKTGTSFTNTLVTWGCKGLKSNEMVSSETENSTDNTFVGGFLSAHQQECGSLNICGGHHALGNGTCNNWDEHRGQFVGMFRQPEQRLASGFYARRNGSSANYTLASYAEAHQGCVTKMILGIECAEYSHGARFTDGVTLTQSMVDQARVRLQKGFAFVGLTEEWELSVCLFHAMFGSACHPREFENIRQTGAMKTDQAGYDISELGMWMDEWDAQIYRDAVKIFWDNTRKYKVSYSTCRDRVCKDVPEPFERRLSEMAIRVAASPKHVGKTHQKLAGPLSKDSRTQVRQSFLRSMERREAEEIGGLFAKAPTHKVKRASFAAIDVVAGRKVHHRSFRTPQQRKVRHRSLRTPQRRKARKLPAVPKHGKRQALRRPGHSKGHRL